MSLNPIDIIDESSTIAAISTPAGVGGIAVVRISGPDALQIANKIWKGRPLHDLEPRTVHLGYVHDTNGEVLDESLVTVFRAPNSYTGQDTVEFAIHGSTYIQREILAALIAAGARTALPGEYTRRAFTSGRLHLTQAEAVADIIACDSRAAHRLAVSQLKGTFARRIDELHDKLLHLVTMLELELDFAEEDVNFADRSEIESRVIEIQKHIKRLLATFRIGNAIKNGIPVAIVGPTNVGKSSLLNVLVENDRAIVSDIHGTTRDTIEDTAYIGDFLFRFIDTAGLRATDDPIEQMGIHRSLKAIRTAQIVLNMIDLSDIEFGKEYALKIKDCLHEGQTQIVIANKSDTFDGKNLPEIKDAIAISTKTGEGIDNLRKALSDAIINDALRGNDVDIIVTNQRHAEALQRALDATTKMLDAMHAGLPTDLIAQDARAITDALAEITGRITSSDILSNIFSRFCIGK